MAETIITISLVWGAILLAILTGVALMSTVSLIRWIADQAKRIRERRRKA